ncbi:MAG TPA: hypothetical protein VKU77_10030 [Streptosporangiaceae bacterium]|nr:hypothetical protein [Streptosporangiaceae bacterium]
MLATEADVLRTLRTGTYTLRERMTCVSSRLPPDATADTTRYRVTSGTTAGNTVSARAGIVQYAGEKAGLTWVSTIAARREFPLAAEPEPGTAVTARPEPQTSGGDSLATQSGLPWPRIDPSEGAAQCQTPMTI